MKPYCKSNLLCAFAWCLAAMATLFIACNEDEKEMEVTRKGKVPEVITYSPEYMEAGSETDAMIMGENFGTDASNVTVKLGETLIPLKEVGNSVIKFKIPNTLDIGTYPLSVEIAYIDKEEVRQTVSHTFEVDFEVRGNVPVISGYRPSTGTYPGGEVTIEGDYFGTDKRNVTITLDGAKTLEVTTMITTAITFTMPEDVEIGNHELKVEIKYGVNAAKTFRKTFQDFQVVTKEYVATSSVYAGTGEQQITNGSRLTAAFYAPYSLAYDKKTSTLYVGEIHNGIRSVTESSVDDYLAIENPWYEPMRKTCAVAVSGDNLYYVVQEAASRSCNFLWIANRTGGSFSAASGHQAWDNDYLDIAVNPVDKYIIISRKVYYFWRTESTFSLITPDGEQMSILEDISVTNGSNDDDCLWTDNIGHCVFSPDGKWLYISRSNDHTDPAGVDAKTPLSWIERYPYDPQSHTLATDKEIVAGIGQIGGTNVGFTDGPVGTSKLFGPRQMCFDSTGETLYFVDQHNHALRKVTDLNGTKTTSTVAGTGSAGAANVTDAPVPDLRNVQFNNPVGIALADDNTFYIGEDGGKVIRKIEIKLKSNN